MSSKVNYTSFKDMKELRAYKGKVLKSASTLRNQIQNLAVGIMGHACSKNEKGEYIGDYSLATELVKDLAALKGYTAAANTLKDWFVQVAGLELNPVMGPNGKDKPADRFNGWLGGEETEKRMKTMRETFWWSFDKAEEDVFNPVDAEVLAQRLIKRMIDKEQEARDYAVKHDLDVDEFLATNVQHDVSPATSRELLRVLKIDAMVIREEILDEDADAENEEPEARTGTTG